MVTHKNEPQWKQALLRSAWFPLVLQIVCLVVFVALIIGGWGVDNKDPAFLTQLRNTNLANLVVWSYWWPILIVVTVVFGRFWCMICPIEPLTSWSARLGLRRPIPRWMRSGWIMTGLYVLVLVVGIHCLAIHRSPHRMALYLLSLVVLAIAVGFVFEKRTFCTHVCPIVPLLRLYSKLATVEWKAIDKAVCEGCKSKDCIAKKNLYHWQGRSCGNSIYPPRIEQNGDCIFCTQCAKVCPYANVTLKWRRPFRDFWNPDVLRSAEAWFVLVVSGFVIYEILTEWTVTKQLLLWLPDSVKSGLGVSSRWYSGLVHATLIFFLLPLVLWSFGWLVDRLSGMRLSFSSYLNRFILAAVPVAAAGHLCKSLLKTTSRLAYIPAALSEPTGIETASAIVEKRITLQAPWLVAADWPITVLMVVFLLLGLGVSLVALRAVGIREKRPPVGAAAVVVSYWLVFAATVVAWRVA